MVAYGFKKEFVPKILDRTKRQTVRAVGKRRHAMRGDVLQLYQGMRTKSCILIAHATCIDVSSVQMWIEPTWIEPTYFHIAVAGRVLSTSQREEFARADGFEDSAAMLAFWQKNHKDVTKFIGLMVAWDLIEGTP